MIDFNIIYFDQIRCLKVSLGQVSFINSYSIIRGISKKKALDVKTKITIFSNHKKSMGKSD